MRRLAFMALLLAACGSSSDGDGLEARAREVLARDGWSEVHLEAAPTEPEGTFDFTGVREGRRCEGTLQVRVTGGRATSSMQSRCD